MPAAPVEQAAPPVAGQCANLAETLDLIETDVLRAMSMVSERAGRGSEAAVETGRQLVAIRAATSGVVAQSSAMAEEAAAVTQASDELARTSGEIAGAVSHADRSAALIAERLDKASAAIAGLADATREIGSILGTIGGIARQTNLLALNATIEAARAGEAGRGFGVVAKEVKNLSLASEAAARAIGERIAVLQQSASGTIASICDITADIAGIRPLLSNITGAVGEQGQATDELALRANGMLERMEACARGLADIDSRTAAATGQSALAEDAARACLAVADGLKRRFVTVIRQAEIGDRRRFDRLPVEIELDIKLGTRHLPGRSVDISSGGILLANTVAPACRVDDVLLLSNARLGSLRARVVSFSQYGVHCAFESLAREDELRLDHLLQSVEDEHRPLILLAQHTADQVARAMTKEIEAGRLSVVDLFDTDYQSVPDTDPVQYTNRALARLEQILPPIQDAVMASASDLVFCIAVDRNGYVPVHQAAYSQPQQPDNPAWTVAHCRNRRIFDDRAGLLAGRSMRPFLIQSYAREMGGGVVTMMREVDAPIVVARQLWGGMRLAYGR
jgi:methyl-accepting chemotaxis protein